jgi:phosphoserine phosphatase
VARPRPRLRPEAERFIACVLDQQPKIAVFDCDGTLWSGDAGEEFLYWEIENKVISPELAAPLMPRYHSYKKGEIGEEQMCGEMVALHRGLKVNDVQAAAERFFAAVVERRIFREMQELVRLLADSGCELWAISSTNEWVIRAGLHHFAIPQQRIIAASVEIDMGRATDRLIRVPTDEGKAAAVREVIGPGIDAAFGNSIHDAALLRLARHGYAIRPTPEMGKIAEQHGWQLFIPQ